jgi:8-oxo-dGTP pyrophosphatase MutT (NUDIX family)
MIAFEKSVGAVIFRREDKIYYLLLNYGKMKNGSHYWNFVKGHTEKGETEEETMRRETKEETGIDDLKIISGFCDNNRYLYHALGKEREERKEKGRKTIIAKKSVYLLAETKSKDIKLSDEHVDFVWLPFKQAIEKLTYKSSRRTLKKANDFLKKNSPS